ncbi:ribbon-helix-helix protein, CopG family [Corynebacterium sp. 3HC-13]|uniref:ribbon-helix-helix domain-containing protein n=1 Tax=Corynebacterium poyangense TaxID=2684405 RepID=UPI001CCB5B0B|nr:ribbon-helix-helix domain-containing protein [Corynebacterium poyangense]MBZ8176202.1 ribbon-helix-helix protein, CopG family [Corynebacterium poyangense]
MTHTNYEQLSRWAESDHAITALQDTIQARGIHYRTEESDTVLKEFAQAGRPTLGHTNSGQGTSPRRQVRLPKNLSDALDRYALNHGMSASQVMREAITQFLNNQAA